MSLKIYTKVMTYRVALVAKKVIKPTQTAYMTGRNIMKGVVILH
jgi:hypothetical protein